VETQSRKLTVDDCVQILRFQAEDMLQENFSLEVENLHHAMSKDEYKQKLAQAKE